MTIFHWGTLLTSLSASLIILAIFIGRKTNSGNIEGWMIALGIISGFLVIVFSVTFFGVIPTERVKNIITTEKVVKEMAKTEDHLFVCFTDGDYWEYNELYDINQINDSTKFYIDSSYDYYDDLKTIKFYYKNK